MSRLNAAEHALLRELNHMTKAQFKIWMRTPRPFDPNVNTARVALASRHVQIR